jgi:YihY family inner membrane protein
VLAPRSWLEAIRVTAPRLVRFARRVVLRFYRKKGLLLGSAVAFNGLLSLVPLVGLAIVILSNFTDSQTLIHVITRQLDVAVPHSSARIGPAIQEFMEARALASGVGIAVVMFFSALAFRTLDDALSAIFDSGRPHKRRHPILSLTLPLMFMGLVIGAMVALSLLVSAVEALPAHVVHLLGVVDVSLGSAAMSGIQVLSFFLIVALFASFYRIMPEAKVTWKQAFVGGLVAATLWEIMRQTLTWWFANVSLVGLIYGSLTTVIILLLTFEVGSLIVLLGGQVIAEVVRSQRANLPWYEEPEVEVWVVENGSRTSMVD